MASIYGDSIGTPPSAKMYMVFNPDGSWHSGHKPEYIDKNQFGKDLIVVEWAKIPRLDIIYRLDLETGIIIEEPLIMSDEQQYNDAMYNLRYQRNQKLKETDWSQAGDVPTPIKEKYQVYRQELRDLPEQISSFAEAVNPPWPQEP